MAMEDMRNELYQLRGLACKHARGEKYALVVVFMSCLIFVIVIMVRSYDSYDSEWCFVLQDVLMVVLQL